MFVVDEMIGVAGCMFCITFVGAVGGVSVATVGWFRVIGVVGALFFVFAKDVVCTVAVGFWVIFVLCAFVPGVVFLFLLVVFVFFAGEGFAPFAGGMFGEVLEYAGGTRVVLLFAVFITMGTFIPLYDNLSSFGRDTIMSEEIIGCRYSSGFTVCQLLA